MGIVFFSGGILCFVLYGYASISLYRLRRSGVRTKGRTVAWRDDEDNAITLEVTFLDQKGIECGNRPIVNRQNGPS
jgi:hypothetical protein